MKPKLLIRIAAGCLLFFAIGHSIGHFTKNEIADPQAQEVLKAMSGYKYNMFGQMRSYDDNYTGMSLNLIFTLLTFVAILLVSAAACDSHGAVVKKILWPIILCVLAFAVTGFMFFFPVPAVTCILASSLLARAAVKL